MTTPARINTFIIDAKPHTALLGDGHPKWFAESLRAVVDPEKLRAGHADPATVVKTLAEYPPFLNQTIGPFLPPSLLGTPLYRYDFEHRKATENAVVTGESGEEVEVKIEREWVSLTVFARARELEEDAPEHERWDEVFKGTIAGYYMWADSIGETEFARY